MSQCGNETTASPGRPGQLKFKCLLWANCPLYERIRQDQTFIFSPETLQYAPQSLRNKMSVVEGLDGAFLRPRPNFYLHNFLAFRKRGAFVPSAPNTTPDQADVLFGSVDIISLPNLEFLGLDNKATANALTLEGNTAINSTAVGSHQTWISDGSLYCSDNVLPSEYDSIQKITDPTIKVRRSFCTLWKYIQENVGQTIGIQNVSGSETTINDIKNNVIYMPTVSGAGIIGDPIQVMKNNNVEDSFKVSDQTYKNINPGIHWRITKRTPLFQGEDFTVEFKRTALQDRNIGSRSIKYRMQDKFKYLDVFGLNEGPLCGSLDADGFWDKGKNNEILENTRKVFDFSRQVYYMVEIGVGDHNHNYILIIAENSYPIFCHIGKTPYLNCSVVPQSDTKQDPPARTNSSGTPANCSDATDGQEAQSSRQTNAEGQSPMQELTVVENPKENVLRKLSTYEAASSLTLLKQEKLRITVRQHGGNIVVTFSGHENSPWVITRKDIDPNGTPIGQPVTQSQVAYKNIHMLIPRAQMSLMGGNRMCGFTFAPLIYESLQNYVMPQPLSVQGPVDVKEIQFLWRDKGINQNPEVSVTLPKAHYTNEAGKYVELAVDPKSRNTTSQDTVKIITTYANQVQPEFVYFYGKAPDMINNSKARMKGIYTSELAINATECVSSAGSRATTAKLMQVYISVIPGGYLFNAVDGGDPWPLKDCVTPIVYNYRMYIPPKGCVFDKTPLDVSQHVTGFSDEWSETDFQKLEHQGSISFLISDGMKFRGNQSNYLFSLVDKAFYLQISMWWENGIMPTPVDERDRVVFTGFCPGGVITTETNKKQLDCKLYDYSKILKDQKFFNSPFFDRMRDVNAVNEILQLAGLRDGEDNDSTVEPGSLVRLLAESDYKGGWYNFYFNGEKIFNREFALPGSYDILQSPFLRFTDGEPFWEAIEKMSVFANKIAFFDRLGVFNFNPLPYDQELWGGQSGTEVDWTIQDWTALSKVDFFATPKQQNIGEAEMHRQIIGDYKIERLVSDVVNEIKVISTSPNGEVFVAGHVNYASLNDPDSPGFLGYHKPFLQMDGIFGSEETVKWIVKNYTRMFIPPIKVTFRAIGRNNIKALDVVTFQPLGSRERQPLIVSSVRSEVDASKNSWFQDFDCLWLFPKQNVQWGNTNEIGLGPDGSVTGAVG